MPANTPTAKIRDSILSRKQLRKDETRKGHLTNRLPLDPTGCKTTLMLYIEGKYKLPIEQLIWSLSIRKAAHLFEVEPRTITRWREKFPSKW